MKTACTGGRSGQAEPSIMPTDAGRMSTLLLEEEAFFHEARRIAPGAGRAAFLGQACGEDSGLKERLQALLRVHEQEAGFLHVPALAALAPTGSVEGPDTVIGPYTLLDMIGEGGMGVVYRAEQTAPVRREVALKIIRPGMDTKPVIARFEAERQALALMDHPNIARVLDVGATEGGRPYFVMELVRGAPITDYCEANRLPVADRLGLFVLVCQAVQHAHQKGIIHRDLKPTNVLVTRHDGGPVPKVIDFGIAKSTGRTLTDGTLSTAFAEWVGTPLYMSPEQAEMGGLDIDTRSDVYSLGVLLYELLTATTPFDRETFRAATFDEVRRIIREQEPPAPSARLASLGGARSTVAANRRVDARQLDRAVRGELDWIAKKALEKDRTRRYETANDFAADVMRHLNDETVEACPPSARYRSAKYARRHRAMIMTVGLVSSALVVGTAVSLWQAARATVALGQAEDSLILGLQAVDELYDQAAERWQNDLLRWGPTLPRPFLEKALRFYERFNDVRRVDPHVGHASRRAGEVLLQLGRLTEAETALRRAEAIFQALRAVDPENPEHLHELAATYASQGELPLKWDERLPIYEEAIRLREELVGRFPASRLHRKELAMSHRILGHRAPPGHPGALEHLERAREIGERLCAEAPDDPGLRCDLGATFREFGGVLSNSGRHVEAEQSCRRAVAIHESLAAQYPMRPQFQVQLGWECLGMGWTLLNAGRLDEVLRFAEPAETAFGGLSSEFPDFPPYRGWKAEAATVQAIALFLTGRRAEAEAKLRRLEAMEDVDGNAERLAMVAWRLVQRDVPVKIEPAYAVALAGRAIAKRPDSVYAWHVMGMARYRAGEWNEAVAALSRANELEHDEGLAFNGFFLAMAYHHKGDPEQARSWYDRSVSWLADRKINDAISTRYRTEAAALLDISKPANDTTFDTDG